jgi:enoyl-CoA hydratase
VIALAKRRFAKASPFVLRTLKKSLHTSLDIQGVRQALSPHFDVRQLSHVSEEYRRTTEAGLANAIPSGARP